MNPRDLNIHQSVSPVSRLTAVKRVSLILLLLLSLLAVLIAFYEWGILDVILNHCTVFKIREVKIAASPPLDEATVRSLLPKVSDKTLLVLRARTVVDPIASQPWVETVAVRKFFPRTLEITVTTKKPQSTGILKGESYYFDAFGTVIDRVSPRVWIHESLPIVNRREDCDWSPAQWSSVVAKWPVHYKRSLSEIWLEKFPYFRVFLAAPRWEMLFSFETWETQLPYVLHLIQYTPSQLHDVRRVNLIIPKKAVVSRAFSK